MSQSPQVVAAEAAAGQAHAVARSGCEAGQHLRGDSGLAGLVQHGLSAGLVGAGLIADRLEAVDAVLEGRVVQIGHARLDSVVEAFQAQLGLSRPLGKIGRMGARAGAARLPPVKDRGEDGLQPLGLQQPLLQMPRDQIVQLLHRYRHAAAGGGPLPRLGRAGVVAVAPAFAGADRHRPAALGAVDQAGQQRGAADDAGRQHLGVARFQKRLNGIEGRVVDDRWNGDDHHLAFRVQGLRFRAPVEFMLAHVGAAGQDAVDLADPPATAVAGEDPVAVEVADDVLDAHLAACAVTFQGEAVDQPHGFGMKGVDLQLLLDLGPALLGRDGAVADGRQRAVPEALPRVLLQGAHHVLGVLLRLVFIEQRHDLPHHYMHRIVAHLLRDGDEPHAVPGELADVELQLEMVAEEAAEGMDHDDIERRGLGRARLDHALEFRAAVVGGRGAGFHEGLDQLIAPGGAPGLALTLLIGDRDVMLGLPRGRDPQVERGALGCCS